MQYIAMLKNPSKKCWIRTTSKI